MSACSSRRRWRHCVRAVTERITVDETENDRLNPVTVRRGVRQDLTNRRHIVVLETAPERVGQKLLGKCVRKPLWTVRQRRSKFGEALERGTVGKRAARIDRIERV